MPQCLATDSSDLLPDHKYADFLQTSQRVKTVSIMQQLMYNNINVDLLILRIGSKLGG